jgi:hypothetical protein
MPELLKAVPEQINFYIKMSLDEVSALNIALDKARIDLNENDSSDADIILHINVFHSFLKAMLGDSDGS